jgi:subtilisin family serine protease
MAANLPGRMVGTAPKANYWLLRTEEVASETIQEEINWAVAAEFADSVGVDIINSSLGYSLFDNAADNHSFADMNGDITIVTKAADLAAAKGIFVCNSAGNSGGPPWYKITAPADGDSVLTVGAVDSIQNIAGFSSRGPTSDGRIKPDVVAKGVDAVIAFSGGDVTRSGGTSFSCPITAGAVACLWQAHPLKTNMELLQAVRISANQSSIPDTIKGYGVPNFCVADLLLVGIEEINQNNILEVYPNPFQSSFSIRSTENLLGAKLMIHDLSGRVVFSKIFDLIAGELITIEGAEIESLSAGSYFIQLTKGDKNFYSKLISNK